MVQINTEFQINTANNTFFLLLRKLEESTVLRKVIACRKIDASGPDCLRILNNDHSNHGIIYWDPWDYSDDSSGVNV